MSTNLLYGVIKSHSLIADLLNSQQIISLAKADNLETFIKLLSDTPYAGMFETKVYTSITLERVFYSKFIQRLSDLINTVPKNIADFLKLYCIKFEVLNLKRIIQGKFNGIPSSQITELLIPLESFNKINFEELVNTPSLDGVIERLAGTRFATLREHIDLGKKYDVMWPFELALNQIYAITVFTATTKLPRNARAIVRKIVGVETDVENLLVALRQRVSSQKIKSYNLEDLFPVRYRVMLNVIEGIIETEDIKAFIENLPSPYSKILAPIYQGDLLLILTYLRRYLYGVARYGRLVNDFGFNVLMAYILFCEIEKDNLVGIAWGKTQKIAVDELLKYLVLPEHTRQ